MAEVIGFNSSVPVNRGQGLGNANIHYSGIFSIYVGDSYSSLNFPSGYGILVSLASTGVMQIFIENHANNPKVYFRNYWDEWSNWVSVN